MSAEGQTLDRWLADAARRSEAGRGIRVLDRRERGELTTWRAIADGADSVRRRLVAAGVRPGDRVALVFPTSLEFLLALFGAVAAGAVPTPLYPPVRLGRLPEYHERTARMISAAGARLVLADEGVRRILGETIQLAPPALGCRTLAELPAPAEVESVPNRPDDLALVQFSSGTTVEPKPVALTHRAVVAQVEALNRFWPDDGGIRHSGVSWLPLYHDMGLIGCVFTALERAATLTLLPPEAFVARPALWLRTLSRFHATISPAPNFAYGLAVEKIRDEELDGCDLSDWRVALNGAESVAPAVLLAFAERFGRWGFAAEALTPVYGLAEAALAVTFSPLGRPFRSERFDSRELAENGRARISAEGREIVSVGRPLPGFAIEIRDAGSFPVPEGTVGRIWVRGPSLMLGYLGQPAATERTLVDGWLDTGDLGLIHDGELFLTGRAKDLLILRGRNYAPEAIEHAIDGVPGARTGCSVAIGHLPEGAGREELWLFVERSRRTEITDAQLADGCLRAVLAATELRADEIFILEPGTLPRTSSGKLRRGETLRLHLAGELGPPDRIGPFRMLRLLARSRRALQRAERARRP